MEECKEVEKNHTCKHIKNITQDDIVGGEMIKRKNVLKLSHFAGISFVCVCVCLSLNSF